MILALTITAIVSAIFSILALAVGIYCAIELQSFKKSTHSIQYIDPSVEKANQEFLDAEKDIDKFNEDYSSELENEMPFFHKGNDELKIQAL